MLKKIYRVPQTPEFTLKGMILRSVDVLVAKQHWCKCLELTKILATPSRYPKINTCQVSYFFDIFYVL